MRYVLKALALVFVGTLSFASTKSKCFEVKSPNGNVSFWAFQQRQDGSYSVQRNDLSLGIWNLIQRARCIDCNEDIFEISGSGLLYRVRFNGTRTMGPVPSEQGTFIFEGSSQGRIQIESSYRAVSCYFLHLSSY